MTIRVLVADDQQLLRSAVVMMLHTQPDIEVVGQAANGLDAVALSAQTGPDVVLMDVRMPVLDGVEATRRIVASGPRPKVLMLTTFDLDEHAFGALQAGASGFLLKDASGDTIIDAVRSVDAGDAVISPSTTRRLLDHVAGRLAPSARHAAALQSLTGREWDVFRELASGASNAEIAERLFLSETTVKTHVGHVLRKLGVRDRVQAVVVAYESGIVRPSPRVRRAEPVGPSPPPRVRRPEPVDPRPPADTGSARLDLIRTDEGARDLRMRRRSGRHDSLERSTAGGTSMTTHPHQPSPAGPRAEPSGEHSAESPAAARPPGRTPPIPRRQETVIGHHARAPRLATPPRPEDAAARSLHRRLRWETTALLVAGGWSVVFLIRGVGWLAAWPALDHNWLRNPFDPAVDADGELTSVLTGAGARGSAAIITAVAATGLVLVLAMATMRPPAHHGPAPRRWAWPGTAVTALTAVQAFVLAVLLPDFRVIATIGYTPVLLGRQLFEKNSPYTLGDAYTPVTVAMLTMTVAGLAFAAAAVGFRRRWTAACLHCGRTDRPSTWTSPAAAARWGRWATVVAIVIPVGYAITRWAWALGIPLGVRQSLLDDLGSGVWMGAFLGSLAIGGAILTAGLVRPWGEVFPRWIPGLRGRRVPIAGAVVPALFVAVITASAGLMFLRIAITGRIPSTFGGTSDVAAWLPEIFWPLWGAALATAAIGYWLRRRWQCPVCGRGAITPVR